MEVKDIFDTEGRGETIWNFQKFMDLEIRTSQFEFPQDFYKGKDLLSGSVIAVGVNCKRLEEARQCFQESVGQSGKARVKLYAYLGMIVCNYVIDDLGAISRLIKGKVECLYEDDKNRNILSRVNPTGVGQNILKGLGVATGGVLSAVSYTRPAGIAIMQWALRIHTEDVLEPDYSYSSYFYELKQEIMGLEYEKFHGKLKN